jgi:two-component system OmpR family sensor kinase
MSEKEEIKILKLENEKLKKLNLIKSDLISISAHELRTSLSALKWILKMFIDKDLGKITSEQEAFVGRALNSSDRMIDLVNKLLTHNHSDELEIPFIFEDVNVIHLIEQTIFEFFGETQKKEVPLIFLKPQNEFPTIKADSEMLRVVFQNLIENAIKYSRKDDKVFISLKKISKTKNIEISIRDTGIGIKKEDQERIFDKFFRCKNAVEKDALGSGLGLYTTQNIIRHHKGKIWFESSLEFGTTFYINLPIS